jgi:hypothetical protein
MSIADKYLQLAESYQDNFSDFDENNTENFNMRLPIRANVSQGRRFRTNVTGVPGEYPTGAMVGNIGLTVIRKQLTDTGINANLPVPIGSGFDSMSAWYFILQKILIGVEIKLVESDAKNNHIEFVFKQGTAEESVKLTGGNSYDLFRFNFGLVNIKAFCDKLRISLPTEDANILNTFERDGIRLYNTSWLSNVQTMPVKVSRAPGQFNKSIYDSNLPFVLSNTQGVAIYIPKVSNTVNVETNTDLTFYFNRIERI